MNGVVLRGWKVSFYTGKLHSYLCYKRIPFQFKSINAFELNYVIPKKVGAWVMPVLQTAGGQYLQDTHDIIMALEKQCPERPILPSEIDSYDRRILSFLVAAWADEFWIPTAMYYRWYFPESVEFFKTEAHRQLLGTTFASIVPSLCTRPLINKIARTLTSYLPSVGVRPSQASVLEAWTNYQLNLLENHFAEYDYILGTETPTIGDFGLAGPLIAHLCRDPYPLNNLMHRFPHVMKYAERMTAPSWVTDGKANELPQTDVKRFSKSSIPRTLIPVISSIFDEFIPMIEATQREISKLKDHPKFSVYGENRGLPRALSDISFPVLNGAHMFTKAALPFNVWKFQQVVKEFQSLSEQNKSSITGWFKEHNVSHTDILLRENTAFPTLQRIGLRVKL